MFLRKHMLLGACLLALSLPLGLGRPARGGRGECVHGKQSGTGGGPQA